MTVEATWQGLVDSHCHLQDERLARDLDAVLQRACSAGVRRMVCCGSSEDDWDAVLKLAQSYGDVIVPALGLHPWYIKDRSPHWLERLAERLHAWPAAGVGECGLDHAIEGRDDAEQERVLLAQLELAHELKRPVWLHVRRAWGRLPAILTAWGPHEAGIGIHSYSGPVDLLEPLARLNVYFSFSGTLTRSNNRRGRTAAAMAPVDRLLMETDAPDLPPVIRAAAGDTYVPDLNEPANLVYVLAALADVRGWTKEKTSEVTTANARRLLSVLESS